MKKQFNNFYIVKKGESINTIAEKYGVNPTTILIENHITPLMIKEGCVLFIKRKS